MLAEIAAANAAFKLIKTALNNGKELYDCSEAAQSYFSNKSAITKRVAKKGRSDLDAFMALEKIKADEEWLKDYMIYAGRADMWSDWLAFQSQCKRERDKETRMAFLKRQQVLGMLKNFVIFIGLAVSLIPVMIYSIILMVKK